MSPCLAGDTQVPTIVVMGMWELERIAEPDALANKGELAQLKVHKCQVYDLSYVLNEDISCTTVMFAPDSGPESAPIVSIMRSFAAANGLVYGTDVVGAHSASAVATAVASAPGTVGTGVIFDSPAEDWATKGADGELSYQIWVNVTIGTSGRGGMEHSCSQIDECDDDGAYVTGSVVQPHVIAMQQALDAAIIGQQVGRTVDIKVAVGRMPELVNLDRLEPNSIVQANRHHASEPPAPPAPTPAPCCASSAQHPQPHARACTCAD